MSEQVFEKEIAERPSDFRGPNLSPVGLELRPHEIGAGVFALLANEPVKDHNGVVFGSKSEKQARSANMYDDRDLFESLTSWRLPDIVFDEYAEIDLGGQTVELHHFGAGNGPGDTIVHVPSTRTAWTGNFVARAGTPPMLLQAGPEPYLRSLRAMRDALPDVETIVAGHGPMGSAPEAVDFLLGYLERLSAEVAEAVEAGRTVEETIRGCTDPWADGFDAGVLAAIAAYPVPTARTQAAYLDLCRNLHRLNVLTTYRAVEK